MASAAPRSVLLLACLRVIVLMTAESNEITVKPGDIAVLTCVDPGGSDVQFIEWQKSDKHVFVWRNGRVNEEDQDPTYRGRVEMLGPHMKDGSVVLRNVSVADAGTYRCRVRRGDRAELTNITTLTVEPGSDENGGDGQRAVEPALVGSVLTVVAFLVVGIVCLILRKREPHMKNTADLCPLQVQVQVQEVSTRFTGAHTNQRVDLTSESWS